VTASQSTIQCHHHHQQQQQQQQQQHYSDRPSANAKVASTHGALRSSSVGKLVSKHESEGPGIPGRDVVDGVIRHTMPEPRAEACREGVSWRQMDEKIV